MAILPTTPEQSIMITKINTTIFVCIDFIILHLRFPSFVTFVIIMKYINVFPKWRRGQLIKSHPLLKVYRLKVKIITFWRVTKIPFPISKNDVSRW